MERPTQQLDLATKQDPQMQMTGQKHLHRDKAEKAIFPRSRQSAQAAQLAPKVKSSLTEVNSCCLFI